MAHAVPPPNPRPHPTPLCLQIATSIFITSTGLAILVAAVSGLVWVLR